MYDVSSTFKNLHVTKTWSTIHLYFIYGIPNILLLNMEAKVAAIRVMPSMPMNALLFYNFQVDDRCDCFLKRWYRTTEACCMY